MGASRKLQGEIDRVLKKVQEGVDIFDSIWNKVYDTDNANQKEKFEADLKKEIKKLQRYRDQIKTWIQSSEIKDKKVSASYEQALMDSRKLIEREMERFKICEKETKTKAFSKEGLGQQPKTDPREKAKSETRDWLNNVVSELESQVDYFEAEIEGLSVKKGKTKPPRLAHLDASTLRHKAHIMKLELILRLLDNDELSPEQVNDVRDFLEDYVERNQDDFEEFGDVDELYSSLPLDKVDSIEDLVPIAPPSLVKGVGVTSAVLSLKSSVAALSIQTQGNSTEEPVEEAISQDSNTEIPPRTPPSKNGVLSTSASATPAANSQAALTISTPSRTLATASAILSSPASVRGALDNSISATVVAPSPISLSSSVKEEEIKLSSLSLAEPAVGNGIGSGPVPGGLSSQLLNTVPSSFSSATPIPSSFGTAPPASELPKRTTLGADDRIGSGGVGQSLVSPLSNRVLLTQISKSNEAAGSTDPNNVGEQAVLGGRAFSSSMVPGVQWRPHSGTSFQNPNDAGQSSGRAEIPPDQREKYLQRFQQVQQQQQQQQHNNNILGGGAGKQFSSQQQKTLLQQFNSQSSSLPSQVGLAHGSQSSVPNTVHQQSTQHSLISSDVKIEDQTQTEDPRIEAKNIKTEDEPKTPFSVDRIPGGSGTVMEREIDQPSVNLGVIGRRSVPDIGDNTSGYDHMYNLQMLEAASYKLPQPKDSERAKPYIPRHPAVTPSSYPQVEFPIVENPAFWEKLGMESWGTDTLFFAFYYQQNTYQQYLAARELKKQSWRYHRKYNTWFQRHEEPKVTTDEYEQGTYVYFDFHTANDDSQQGWVQRIRTEFTFEYSYLEDELLV